MSPLDALWDENPGKVDVVSVITLNVATFVKVLEDVDIVIRVVWI